MFDRFDVLLEVNVLVEKVRHVVVVPVTRV